MESYWDQQRCFAGKPASLVGLQLLRLYWRVLIPSGSAPFNWESGPQFHHSSRSVCKHENAGAQSIKFPSHPTIYSFPCPMPVVESHPSTMKTDLYR